MTRQKAENRSACRPGSEAEDHLDMRMIKPQATLTESLSDTCSRRDLIAVDDRRRPGKVEESRTQYPRASGGPELWVGTP
jgi:hypothetical protein